MKNKKCFIKKWKYFWELNGNEKVMTLNQETGEKEWQLPSDWQVFDNSELGGEMFKIETVDSESKKGELVVSEKHRVYANNVYFNPSNLTISSVVNISISDCSLKAGSSDQIGVLISSSGIFDGDIFYEQHFLASLCFNSSANLMQSSSVNLLSLNKSLTIANSNLITNCSITLAKANSNLSFNSTGISTLTQISSILNLDINNKELYKSFGFYDENNGGERSFADKNRSHDVLSLKDTNIKDKNCKKKKGDNEKQKEDESFENVWINGNRNCFYCCGVELG